MESSRVTAKSAAAGEGGGYRQRQGHRNRFTGFSTQFAGWTTTFFFYNFPEELEAKFLWNCFQMYGKVVDVYLPSKRDKRGKRYGFVRLTGVKNEIQMEMRLNEIWIGSYKMRVKIANDRQRKTAMPRKIQGAVKNNGSTRIMNRLVQPGQSYAQAVKSKGKSVNKASEQIQEKDYEAASDKEKGKIRLQESMEREKTEEIIEFIPTGEELQWLEGGMVAVMKSMASVTEIQEQLDADGGSILLSPIGGRRVLLTERVAGSISEYKKHNEELFGLWFESIKPWEMAPKEKSRMLWLRISGVPLKAWAERCFQLIGETVGEVLMVHDDTKKKSILWDGRVLVLSSEAGKISRKTKLKVGEQVHEIEIVEEEWRSDPDWWLSEDDRKSDLETESDYSQSWCQNEDPELDMDVIGEGEDMGNGSEHLMKEVASGYEQLMKELDSNSNQKATAETESSKLFVQETVWEEDESYGQPKVSGPQRLSLGGLEGSSGPTNQMDQGLLKEMSRNEPNSEAQNAGDPSAKQKSKNTRIGSKKQKPLRECYPESIEEIWEKGAPWVTPRTRQRQTRREETQQAGAEKVCKAAAISISDGCIVNRNRVMQREMSMHEVRRLMGVGKRLGFNFDNNEEEVQSKLLEVVDREGAGQRDASGM
ncbi:hypothetical protein SLA2020_059220 [Shorea laevis]